MSSHCFSNHFCLFFPADDLTTLHNGLYSIVACSDSLAFSLIFLFSVVNFNFCLLIHLPFGRCAKGIVTSTACCIILQSLVTFPSILSSSIPASVSDSLRYFCFIIGPYRSIIKCLYVLLLFIPLAFNVLQLEIAEHQVMIKR